MFMTPKRRMPIIILAILLYLTAPLIEWYYFSTELARGSFQPSADSILLPIWTFLIGWALGAPVASLLLWYALFRYPGQVSLFGFNHARPYWSLAWSILFAVLVFCDLFFAVTSAYRWQPLDLLQSVTMVYLLLCLRASIVYRNSVKRVQLPV